MIFPPSSSVPRRSSSLLGVPQVGSPVSSVLLKRSDFPPPFPPRFVSFAPRYRGGALPFALTGGRAPDAGEPGPLVAGGPPGAQPWRRWDLPGSCANPCALALALRPRGDLGGRPLAPPRCCLRYEYGVRLSRFELSRLDHVAVALAVYASWCGSPRYPTQDSLPAGGQPLPCGTLIRWVRGRRFQVMATSSFPLLQACLAQTQNSRLKTDNCHNENEIRYGSHDGL
jgi:hypothetical protein